MGLHPSHSAAAIRQAMAALQTKRMARPVVVYPGKRDE